jgi:hypothetical protein
MKQRDNIGGMVASRMIILKHILEKYGMAVWNGFNWLRI